jgi:hypothetical protein
MSDEAHGEWMRVAPIEAVRWILNQSGWTLAERVAVALMLDAVTNGAPESVSCFAAYDAAGLDHTEVDAFVGQALVSTGVVVLRSDDGHVLVTHHTHETGPCEEIVEEYTCGAPGCGNHLGEMRYRADTAGPAPIAGGSGPSEPGTSSRRAARKRARQNRKRGHR